MGSFHLPGKSHSSDSFSSPSYKGLCVHVPQVPSAGLWGHPQVSQDGPFFGDNMVLDCLSEPCISSLLPCCILVPRDIFL